MATGAVVGLGGGAVIDRGWRRGAFGSLIEGPGYEAWHDWETRHFPGTLALINGAILAASPHNTQPWRFRVDERRVAVYADPERHLSVIDPFDRERLIGLGCAVENLVTAGSGLGFATQVEWFPGADPDLVAAVAMSPSPPLASPRFDAIGRRHTNRGAYLHRPIDSEHWTAFLDLAEDPQTRLLLLSADQREGWLFAQATIVATQRLIADPVVLKESHRWFRSTPAEANRFGDGLTLAATGLPESTIRMALLMPGPTPEEAGQHWLAATRDQHCATASLFGLIAVRDPVGATALLAAGRLWQRLHLEATARGVAMQPLNQLMERADRDRAAGRASPAADTLAALVGDSRWSAVFGFRAGWPEQPALPSPRRPVDRVTELG